MTKTNLDQIEQALFDSVFSERKSSWLWEPEYCPKCDSNQAQTRRIGDGPEIFECYTCGYRTETQVIEETTKSDDLRSDEEERK